MAADIRRDYTKTALVWHEEDFRAYQPGGFHTVTLGDKLHQNRYIVRHKLGWGGFATVWLAKDITTKQWVAIKIIRADHSARIRGHEAVLNFLSHNSTALETSYVSPLRDHFTHQGPNGTHLCLVSELLGPTLYKVIDACHGAAQLDKRSYYEYLKPQTIIKISWQVLKAVAYLHKHDFVHGDISTKNLAFTTHRVTKLSETDFFENIGKPSTEPIGRRDGKPLEKGRPSQLVAVTRWSGWMDESSEDIRLIDFDASFPKSGPKPAEIHQPVQFRAPESILGNDIDARSDIWSVGIVLAALVFSYDCLYGGPAASTICQIVRFVGNFPPEWQARFDSLDNEHGERIPTDPNIIPTLQAKPQTIRNRTLRPLFPVLRGLLKMRPADRLTAEEALELLAPKTRKLAATSATRASPRLANRRRRGPNPA